MIAEAMPERDGQQVRDRVWVAVNGRILNMAKEELREAVGSEMWSPSHEDMEELRKAEQQLRRERAR